MRVLFSTTAGSGHFGPLIPFAQACSDAGHMVKVAAPTSFATDVSRAGLDHAPFDDVPPDVMGPVFGRLPEMSFELANATVMGEIFGRLDAQAALPGVVEIVDAWNPDVVVREPCEFASLVAAERAGVPQVQVAIGMGPLDGSMLSVLATPLAELSVLADLPEDGAMRTLMRMPGFTTVPAALDGVGSDDRIGDIDTNAAGTIRRFHDPSLIAGAGDLPPLWGDPGHPLVYVTFGSVTAGVGSYSAIYAATLRALADMPLRVLMTTGRGIDPASLAPIPANIHVEQWWPHADVMPHTAVVVGHGGFGTTMMTLAAGVPQVIVPLFAFDQTINAERVAAIGAGKHVVGGPDAVGRDPVVSRTRAQRSDLSQRRSSRCCRHGEAASVTESVPILQNLTAR